MYSDFYGFSEHPFQPSSDPACYFDSLGHGQAMTGLIDALALGEGFVVLSGESGTGKTVLVARLLATMDSDRSTSARLADGGAGPTIPAVARAFGLPIETRHPFTIDALLGFLRDEARAGRRCLLIVENVQNLSIAALESLRQLSNFKLGERPLLQILLIGRPAFRTRLQCHSELEPLRRRVLAMHHLAALQVDEVENYIHHHLQRVGWHRRPCFDPGIFAEIHAVTGGVPALVNQIASRLLLFAAAEERDHIDRALLSRVVAEGEVQNPELVGPILKTRLEAALTRCEGQIAELQQAVGGLVGPGDEALATHHRQDRAALQERLGSLESRVIEQERTIRHTLTMLIEWIERDEAHGIAA